MLMEQLSAPFPPDVVSWRPGGTTKDKKKAQALAYIDARDVQNRLDAVFPLAWEDDHYNAGDDHICCRITVTLPDGTKVSRTNGCWVGNVDVTPTRDGKVESKEEDRADREAKWALSDAFKRAATMFGIGKYLYDMPSPYMPLNEFGRFDDSTVAKLRDVAAKPFNEWQRARKERAQEREERRRQVEPPAAAAPAPPPPAAPAEEPHGDEAPIATFERRFGSIQKAEFGQLVAHTREMFPKGSDEYKRLVDAIGTAAKRLGIEPKPKRDPSTTTSQGE